MKYTIRKRLKKVFWHICLNSVFEDVKNSTLKDDIFLRELRRKRNAKIYLSKKHLPAMVEKVVNEMLSKQQYVVIAMEYNISGMEIIVAPKIVLKGKV